MRRTHDEIIDRINHSFMVNNRADVMFNLAELVDNQGGVDAVAKRMNKEPDQLRKILSGGASWWDVRDLMGALDLDFQFMER